MKSRAAMINAVGDHWHVEEIEVDAPKFGEVVVEWKAAGLCHSDEHLVTGDMVPPEEVWELMGIAPMTQTWNKEIKGTIFGSLNPRVDIPKLLSLYRDGQLKLDELITKRYDLDDINVGYQALRDGENLRGVIVHG